MTPNEILKDLASTARKIAEARKHVDDHQRALDKHRADLAREIKIRDALLADLGAHDAGDTKRLSP
jgi:hypothetical protein